MPERTIHTTMVCLLAVLLTVGFTAAPVTAIDGVSTGDDGVSVQVGDEEITVEEDGTDSETADENTDDSTDGVMDGVDPDADEDHFVNYWENGAAGAVVYEITLDDASDGPGTSGYLFILSATNTGALNSEIAINDGENDYAIYPSLGYDSDGTGFGSAHVHALDNHAGATVTCDGEECHIETDGTPAVPAPAVPAPTGQDGDDDDGDDGSQDRFPEEICTDVGDEVYDAVPWNDLPWIGDLPEEAQPPNLPADLVHPRLVASLVSGVTPNQCDVQDPNDPSYDPTEDGVNPDADEDHFINHWESGAAGAAVYDTTLDDAGDGPGTSGYLFILADTSMGMVNSEVALNDGEKDYAIYPSLGYDSDGTGFGSVHAGALNKRGGATVTCDGEACHLDTTGTTAVPAPAIPAPTGQENDDGGDDGDDGSQARFPEEACTDVGNEVADNVPWHDIPWLNDLPEEAQPEDVPTQLVGPWTIGNILSSGSVTQCDVQDPNDPSYNPTEDGVNPDANEDHFVNHWESGAAAAAVYDTTLDDAGDGPGTSGYLFILADTSTGMFNSEVALNDGEKDYAIHPRAGYWSEGSAFAATDVYALGYRAGVEVVCDEDGCDGGQT